MNLVTRRTATLVGIVALAAGVASCRRPGSSLKDEPGGGAASAGRLGDHWVQDERLREVMRRIARDSERWPAGVPEADEAFADVAALADGLAAAARQIPRSVADHPMSAEDRAGFNGEAERLREQALRLGKAARARRVEPMQRELDAISSSCISCHSRYRDFTGELGARKASAR